MVIAASIPTSSLPNQLQLFLLGSSSSYDQIAGANTRLNVPSGVAIDSKDHIYVTNLQGVVGGSVEKFILPTPSPTPNGSPTASPSPSPTPKPTPTNYRICVAVAPRARHRLRRRSISSRTSSLPVRTPASLRRRVSRSTRASTSTYRIKATSHLERSRRFWCSTRRRTGSSTCLRFAASAGRKRT